MTDGPTDYAPKWRYQIEYPYVLENRLSNLGSWHDRDERYFYSSHAALFAAGKLIKSVGNSHSWKVRREEREKELEAKGLSKLESYTLAVGKESQKTLTYERALARIDELEHELQIPSK